MKKILTFGLLLFAILTYGQNTTTANNLQAVPNYEKRLKIGDEIPTNLHTNHPYNPTGVEGVIFEQEFHSKNASYIKIYFKNFNLAPGDYVEISTHNTGESIIYAGQGKIVDRKGNMISNFWAQALLDDRVTVRLHSQTTVANHYGFEIETVAYGYPQWKIDQVLNQKAICNTDDKEPIICYNGTQMYTRGEAVCRLLIGGSGTCTGWLLGCDGHIMTNNHCIGGVTDAQNTDFLFNYQNTNCNGTGNSTADLVASSSTFIKTNATLDYTLVQLPVNPTATYGNLSLSSVAPAVNDRIYIPQHPGGRRKEIAVTTDIGGNANGEAIINSVGGNGCRYYADTEGGSSGSPVLDFNTNLVVAIHNTGGCTNGSSGRSDRLIADIGIDMPTCGIDSGGSNAIPCVNTVTAFPYVESFENTLGLWIQNTTDDFDWIVQTGATPTPNTGPTAANDGAYYAYIESNSPNSPVKTAILESPCFDLRNVPDPQLSFDYHMFGGSVNNMQLEVSLNGSIWATIWSQSGAQGNTWLTENISLAAYTNAPEVRFRFSGTTGIAATGDMAIDAFFIGSSPCTPITTFPYNESFENTLGVWRQSSSDNFDWTNQTGATPSAGTGPTAANNGSYYMFIEASSPNYPGKNAILMSPCFDLSGIINPELRFDYHMFGATTGTLVVEASIGGGPWTAIWSKSGDQGNSWNTQVLSLAPYTTATDFQVRFNATTTNDFTSDIAIDAFSIAIPIPIACGNSVSTFPYVESFENTLGAWTQNTNDSIDWTILTGATPSTGTGPTTANDGAYYIYMEATNPNFPNKNAILSGPCFNLTNLTDPLLIFNYHLFGTNMGSLDLEVSVNGINWASIKSISGSQGNIWVTDTIDLSGYNNANSLRVRFRGVTGAGWSSDIAIDAFSVISGTTVTNVATVQNEDFLTVMPNPFSDYIRIETNITDISNYTISNIQGQLVQTGRIQNQVISTQNLAQGVYFISFTNGEKHLTKKIIKR